MNIEKKFYGRHYGWEEELITKHLNDLESKGLVKPLDHGAFTRRVQNDVDVQVGTL